MLYILFCIEYNNESKENYQTETQDNIDTNMIVISQQNSPITYDVKNIQYTHNLNNLDKNQEDINIKFENIYKQIIEKEKYLNYEIYQEFELQIKKIISENDDNNRIISLILQEVGMKYKSIRINHIKISSIQSIGISFILLIILKILFPAFFTLLTFIPLFLILPIVIYSIFNKKYKKK